MSDQCILGERLSHPEFFIRNERELSLHWMKKEE